MTVRKSARRTATGVVALCLALGASIVVASAASGKGGGDSVDGPSAQASATISSAGPLNNIFLSDQLNCQVDHVGDTSHEFFGGVPGACATLIATGGTLYGPSAIPAGGSAAPRTTYTVVSQTGVTGSGSAGDPFKVVTVVDAGSLRLTQTDSYIIGTESYRTDVMVTNKTDVRPTSFSTAPVTASCRTPTKASATSTSPPARWVAEGATTGVTPNSRIERWVPITAGSSAFEAGFDAVWAAIGTKAAFNNTCLCTSYIDNGAGLSWSSSVGSLASATFSHDTIFSPLGQTQPFITKTAALGEVNAGGQDSYTVTVTNPLGSPVTLTSITDHLPAGFSYIAGSTSGGITTNPTVSGQDLTWSGSFVVPPGGTLVFTFGVNVSEVGGVYTNSVVGTAAGGVVGTGETAPIDVVELVVAFTG